MIDRTSLDAIAGVAETVGTFCLSRFVRSEGTAFEVKGPTDYVSAVDHEAEKIARQLLAAAFPGVPVVGEEGGGTPAETFLVVDPLDGTTNYLAGLPLWGVSIALVRGDEPVLGAISAPAIDLAVAGGPGVGLFATGMMDRRKGPAPSLVAVGRNQSWSPALRAQEEQRLEQAGHTIVSLGSCSVSLALVALGRLAGYMEAHSRLWDCAAGAALCRAAGATAEIVAERTSFEVSVMARSSQWDIDEGHDGQMAAV